MMRFHAVRRFLKYTLVGGSTFGLDLFLIWVMTEFLSVPYWLSTAFGFGIAVSINYFVSRKFVFKGTARRLDHGYAYFILVAVGAMAAITGSVTLLVTLFGINYLFARVLVGGFTGIMNYLFNLHFNFKVAGHHL